MIEYYHSFIKSITIWQYKLNSIISTSLREEGSLTLSLTVIGIAFLYGVLHALGPGHGKALVSFYFISNDNSYKKAFKMGYLVSAFHALSALVVTFTIYFILQTIFSRTFREITHISMDISAVLIILVGLYIIYEGYKHKTCREKKFESKKSELAVAFSAGIVPCPGVMTIVLFAVTLQKYFLAFFSAIAMSVGMGLTISLAAILTLFLKDKVSNKFSSKLYLFSMFSGVLIILLGVFLLKA